MAENPEKNTEKKTILFLYLMHHPDHGYNIVREFQKAQEAGCWGKKKTSDLTNYKVYTILKQMSSEDMIQGKKTRKPESDGEEKQRERAVMYHPNPEFFLKFKKEGTTGHLNQAALEIVLEYVKEASPEKQRCIKEIAGMKKYDMLTLLCYLKRLVIEIGENEKQEKKTEYVSAAKNPFEEIEAIRKISDEISKTKKTERFLKNSNQNATYQFFRERAMKRNIPDALMADGKITPLLENLLDHINRTIVSYASEERM